MEHAMHQAFHIHTCSAAVALPSGYCCRLSLLVMPAKAGASDERGYKCLHGLFTGSEKC